MRDFADRVIVTRSGSIVEKGPVRRVFGVPHHPCPRALLAARLDPGPAVQAARHLENA